MLFYDPGDVGNKFGGKVASPQIQADCQDNQRYDVESLVAPDIAGEEFRQATDHQQHNNGRDDIDRIQVFHQSTSSK